MRQVFPIEVMSGAEWNILDPTGCRIAVCGYDGDHEGSGRYIAAELVAKAKQAVYWQDRYTELERQGVDHAAEIDELRWVVANLLILCRRTSRAKDEDERKRLTEHAVRIAATVGCELPGVCRDTD